MLSTIFKLSSDEENDGNFATSTLPTRITTTRKSEEACQIIKNIRVSPLSFHIVNGEGADVGEFPHMCAIGFGDDVDQMKIEYACGGSLISKVGKYFHLSKKTFWLFLLF